MTDIDVSDERHLHEAAERLHQMFDGVFSTETIEQLLTDSFTRLGATARVRTYLPLLAERFTRERLHAAAKKDGHMLPTDTPTVLFLCVHNAGRSQMAAGYMSHLGQGRVEVRSAGSSSSQSR